MSVADVFVYREGALYAEDVALARIADEVGTPVYVYAQGALEAQYRAFTEALNGLDALVCYALKANDNRAVIAILARQGAGADVVSEGELRLALAGGVPADKIVFSGVGKSADEMRFALKSRIHQFNVESEEELHALDAVAQEMGVRAPVALRVNPDVDAQSHDKITTGRAGDKFGVPIGDIPRLCADAAKRSGIALEGLAVHIGSQIARRAPFDAAFARLGALVRALRADGTEVKQLDLGGGVAVLEDETAETLSLADYAASVRAHFGDMTCRFIFEPGRILTAPAGVLVARVLRRKGRFVVLDAAMNDFMRPALYGARHPVHPLIENTGAAEPCDIVGPVCESGDAFQRAYRLPVSLKAGDYVAIRRAGAYGAVLASSYNARLLVPEVLVRGRAWACIRARGTHDALLARDALPPWMPRPMTNA